MRRLLPPFLFAGVAVSLLLALAAHRRSRMVMLPVPERAEIVTSVGEVTPPDLGKIGERANNWQLPIFAVILTLAFVIPWFLPREAGQILFLTLVTGSFGYASVSYRQAIRRAIRALGAEIRLAMRRVRATHDTLEVIPVRQAFAEIGILAVIALVATGGFLDTDPSRRLQGGEADWLTSSAYLSASSLREYGYIPLWQSYLENGEPLIDGPFSFVLNPISIGPSLLFGGALGIRISVTLYAILAGIGGWALGRTLGFAVPGRMLLGLLLASKGNMLAMIGTGYFQLGITQAYFPWIVAAAIATLRNQGRRWPVILLAVSFALLFSAGNIWYTLPMLLTVGLLGVTHVLGRKLDWRALLRLLLAGVLALSLSAVTLLPIWANRTLHTGVHPEEVAAGWVVNPGEVIRQYFSTNTPVYLESGVAGRPEFYHSFVAPLWFFIAAFAIFPLVWFIVKKPGLHPPPLAHPWRIWGVAVFLLIVATVWGSGGNPVMIWLYEHIPLLRQWRFVGRALAWGAFLLAVLLAARVDGLWRAALQACWRDWIAPMRSLRWVAALALVALSGLAASQTVSQWQNWSGAGKHPNFDETCLHWLRQREPDRPLTVYRLNYDIVYPFLKYRVRLHDIEADYQALPQPSTMGHVNLLGALPEFAFGWDPTQRNILLTSGYRAVAESPRIMGRPCLYHNPDTLSYAFTIPRMVLNLTYRNLPVERTTPVTTLRQEPGHISVWVHGDNTALRVLTLQETAFPGWHVAIDGQPTKLEVVGGMISVLLPPDDALHEITFEYRPSLLYQGGAITLLTCAFCILVLLRADRLLHRRSG